MVSKLATNFLTNVERNAICYSIQSSVEMNLASLDEALKTFSTKHTLVSPQRECTVSETQQAECLLFTSAPIGVACEFVDAVPTFEMQEAKYLWVITATAVPFGKEVRESAKLKHSNLTGGGLAYCGGEVWFADESSLYLNGGSGRYPCEDDEEMLSNVKSFYMDIGYRVAVPPIDEGLGTRPRVFKSAAMVEWEAK